MPDVTFTNLLVVAAVAFLAPLLLGFLPRVRIPSPVVEIVAGVLLGPSLLGWVRADLPVQILAVVGLAVLLFLAGLEIDLAGLRGRPLAWSTAGYLITLVAGLAIGAGLAAADWVTARSCSPSPFRPPHSGWWCRYSRMPARPTGRSGS